MDYIFAAPAVALMASAIAAAFATLFATLFPRLSALDCAFIAPPLGLSLSAWLVLVLKTLPFAGKGISSGVLLAAIMLQCVVCAVAWPRVSSLVSRNKASITGELSLHRKSLALLAVISVWWFYMSHIHYLFKRGNDYLAGGSVYAGEDGWPSGRMGSHARCTVSIGRETHRSWDVSDPSTHNRAYLCPPLVHSRQTSPST